MTDDATATRRGGTATTRGSYPRESGSTPDAATTFPYYWRVRTRLPERFGKRCRVLCRGAMNSCLVEFEDGLFVCTSRWYVRRAP